MRLIALVDEEEVDCSDPQFESEGWAEKRSMEFYVVSALRSLGHEVRVLPFALDLQEIASQLNNKRPELVFNLTERVRGDRSKDLNVAAMLELLRIPYTGSGPAGLLLGRDKALSKEVVGFYGVKVPKFFTIPVGTTKLATGLGFPLIVKLQMADGSCGLSLRSVARNGRALRSQVKSMHASMGEALICEEYVDGREITVFVLGNNTLEVFPAGEIKFDRARKGCPTYATARVVTDQTYRERWGIRYGRAELSLDVEAKVKRTSSKVYRLLRLRDYARLDFRLTAANDVYFIEANPNPALFPDGFGAIPFWAGIDFLHFIDRIVKCALRRRRPEMK